jgi:hypothetical protein
VLEQGRCEPSELVAGEIVWEVVEGVLGVDRVPVDDRLNGTPLPLSHRMRALATDKAPNRPVRGL